MRRLPQHSSLDARLITVSGLKRRGDQLEKQPKCGSGGARFNKGGTVKRLLLFAFLLPAAVLATQRVMVNEDFTRVTG